MIDDLTIDDEASQKVAAYLKEKMEVKNDAVKMEKQKSASPPATR